MRRNATPQDNRKGAPHGSGAKGSNSGGSQGQTRPTKKEQCLCRGCEHQPRDSCGSLKIVRCCQNSEEANSIMKICAVLNKKPEPPKCQPCGRNQSMSLLSTSCPSLTKPRTPSPPASKCNSVSSKESSDAGECSCSEKPSASSCDKPKPACMTKPVEISKVLKERAESMLAHQKCRELTPSQWRDLQIRKLGKDNYCPGAIQDAANGNVNFNALVLNLMKDTFGAIPKDPGNYAPFSLLELFYWRLRDERSNVRHFLSKKNSNLLAAIDLYFQQKIPNNTNRAISSLLKAEKIYESLNPVKPPSFNYTINKMEICLPSQLMLVAFMANLTPA